MNSIHRSLLATAVAALPFMMACSSAQAIIITFDPDEGYTTGALTGQPSSGSTWLGGAGYQVVAGAGVGGTNGAQSTATYTAGFQSFTASAAELGVAEKLAIGQYSFSLAVTMNGNPNGSVGQTGTRIELFGDGALSVVELRILGNGRLRYDNGGSLLNVLDSGGNAFNLAQNATALFEGVINYDTSTYSLAVNGVSQGSAITFSDSFVHAASTIGRFETEHFDSVGYRQITYDNISMAVIPEPGTAALLGVALVGLAILRKKRNVRLNG